jgi:aryl-alcohol dehydrogenase-like predicted oxidoreductase
METRRIGSLEVSIVGLGCNNFGWRIDEAATRRVVDAAIDAGITLFDTADIYGGTKSEAFLGRALGARRSRVIVASKFGMEVAPDKKGARPEYVKQAAEDSLRRLGTDYIDLYQLHQPDPAVPIAETLGALDDLVRAGKVREIGCSNMTAGQLREADAVARAASGRGDDVAGRPFTGSHARFVSVQNEYSLLHREPEAEVLPECERLGLAFLPYFPLASGLLTGKYHAGTPAPEGARLAGASATSRFGQFMTPEGFVRLDRLGAVAARRGGTLLDLAFAWLLTRPAVASVIAGATSESQVRSNAATAGFRLTNADLEDIDKA